MISIGSVVLVAVTLVEGTMTGACFSSLSVRDFMGRAVKLGGGLCGALSKTGFEVLAGGLGLASTVALVVTGSRKCNLGGLAGFCGDCGGGGDEDFNNAGTGLDAAELYVFGTGCGSLFKIIGGFGAMRIGFEVVGAPDVVGVFCFMTFTELTTGSVICAV